MLIMKKTYISPETNQTIVSLIKMIASSPVSTNLGGLGVSNESAEDAGITSGNSRRSSLWEDEE